jgi:hypothetical protein
MNEGISPQRVLAARVLAVVADAIQLGLVPLFVEGAASPANDILDGVVAVAMIALLGWHWAFVPTLVAEMIPFADLFPTWTGAVLFVTRQSGTVPITTTATPVEGTPPAALPVPPVEEGKR